MSSNMKAICRGMATETKQRAKHIHPPVSTTICESPDLSTNSPFIPSGTFPFLDLPFELRLEIYVHLLPPRTHIIAPTFTYPYGPSISPKTGQPPSPTYTILTKITSPSYPPPYLKIYTSILTISHQIHMETIPFLYGSSSTIFDFGTSVDLVAPFFNDREELARRSVRNLKVARELVVSGPLGVDVQGGERVGGDRKWVDFVGELKSMDGLRKVDFTCWSETGMRDFLPPSLFSAPSPCASTVTCVIRTSPVAATTIVSSISSHDLEGGRWRNWEWTKDLFKLKRLREVKIKMWVFRSVEAKGGKLEGGEGKEGFNYWLACRMVSDQGLRGRAVWDGVVDEEGVIVRL